MAKDPIKLGNFEVPTEFSVFAGAKLNQYPPHNSIPKVGREYHDVANGLFYEGGTLSDFGAILNPGVDSGLFHGALKAYLASFEPKHEHKMDAAAWLISECCTVSALTPHAL
ncbi:hypothetical protein ATL17_1613 [Maritalea mobilis]|uniref:Uncharacterized protein n=1 Tax=Maritalea mobilis TaxID=483324 RepID=A0A4R6VN38_9HYPH|nr:hypothetical protein [Maritalea mobilis]TDQ63606.1 hypothetical protein ATL17_1613 [Maritalea mobilis]